MRKDRFDLVMFFPADLSGVYNIIDFIEKFVNFTREFFVNYLQVMFTVYVSL